MLFQSPLISKWPPPLTLVPLLENSRNWNFKMAANRYTCATITLAVMEVLGQKWPDSTTSGCFWCMHLYEMCFSVELGVTENAINKDQVEDAIINFIIVFFNYNIYICIFILRIYLRLGLIFIVSFIFYNLALCDFVLKLFFFCFSNHFCAFRWNSLP